MKRVKEVPIGDIIHAFLRESGLETPLLQHRLLQAWPSVVGEQIAAKTQATKIINQQLWVKVESPALRTQLQMMSKDIVLRLNQMVGTQIIYHLKLF